MNRITMSAYKNISEIESRIDNKDKRNKVLEVSNNNEIRTFERYYEDESLMLRGEALHGVAHGKGRVFYKNGNIHCLLHYKDGELDGLVQGYYLHGSLALEVVFKMGKAIFGTYYKKNGKKAIMTQVQLDIKFMRINLIENEILTKGIRYANY